MFLTLIRNTLAFLILLLTTGYLLSYLPRLRAQSDQPSIKLGTFEPPTTVPSATRTPPSKTPTLAPEDPPDNPQPTLPETTAVPTTTPTPTIDPKAQSVMSLVQAIQYSCPNGYIGRTSLTCLNDITPPLALGVRQELRLSALVFDFLQCVGFHRALVLFTEGIHLPQCGNAIEYASCDIPGYTFIPKASNEPIRVNDWPVWGVYYNGFGHLAYVIEVYGSGQTFRVAEANFEADGLVRDNRITTIDHPKLLGFWRKQ